MNPDDRFIQFLRAAKSLENDERWAVCVAWMIDNLEVKRQELETAQAPHLFVVQGQVQSLREALAYLTNPGHFLRLLQMEGKTGVSQEGATGSAGPEGD